MVVTPVTFAHNYIPTLTTPALTTYVLHELRVVKDVYAIQRGRSQQAM